MRLLKFKIGRNFNVKKIQKNFLNTMPKLSPDCLHTYDPKLKLIWKTLARIFHAEFHELHYTTTTSSTIYLKKHEKNW